MTRADAPDHGIVLGRPGEATLSLGAPIGDEAAGLVRIPLLLEARGVTASHELVLESWGHGPDGLLGFLDELAAGWRGWAGAKAWSDDHQLTHLRATHDGVGTVMTEISIERGSQHPGSWSVRAFVPIDPGAFQVAANKLRTLLQQLDK